MGASDHEDGVPAPAARLDVSEAERELLLKACKHYRNVIPAYIKSRENERLALDELIKKLSS